MKQNRQQINSPLLYRLTDDDPLLAFENDPKRYISLERLYGDIKQNLEHILNARLDYFGNIKEYAELAKSRLNYGIADFSQQYYSIKKNQRDLCKTIQEVVAHFEPRLQKTKVILLESEIDIQRSFMIRISGEINIKPEPQQAIFESSLDVLRYQFSFDGDE